jgi:hypothetical protein
MVATQRHDKASCTLCQRYGLQIIAARNQAAQLAGRVSSAEVRLKGRPSARVDALRTEVVRLRDSARVSERWLAEHRAEAHAGTVSAAA